MGKRLAGIELGGTKCIAILGSGPDRIEAQVEVPTTSPEETLGRLRDILDDWHRDRGFEALGLGSFGPLDIDAGTIAATAKPGWTGAAVRDQLAGGFDLPHALDTDVTGAALAEGAWGRAQGLGSYCYVTVGTGIGAGVIVNGKPAAGLGHAEAGHIRVARMPGDSWHGNCPFHGDCVEGLASGSAIVARSGGSAGQLGEDDPIWDFVSDALAQMLHALALIATPERVIVGGGVINARPHLVARVRDRLGVSLAGYSGPLAAAAGREKFLQLSALGADVGPLGALALARMALEGSSKAQPSVSPVIA
ncbi:ROK family protein [Sphingopyxis sp. JAI108]|uniref:ROK family protein n=1 Tax=Sphingopyxis sp. JAI108 TaxID=2723060 RepID=UPI0015CD680B|nr:ROK family protein [Sphingopyxis sp. JAI108]NYF30635.1 fructokinase [Sphingopyxis sp. JAI108]